MLFVVLGKVVMLTITVKQFYPACTIIRKNVCIGIVLRNSIFAKLLTSHPLILSGHHQATTGGAEEHRRGG